MVAPFSKFYVKIWVGFCLNTGKRFFLDVRPFILKPTERAQVLLNNSTRDFQNSPLFKRSACFCETTSGDFECFQYFRFEAVFLENENFFQKVEYRHLVKDTKIENASFPYKTDISEANVMRNRMVTTKWTNHKKRSFASNYFIFLEKLFQFKYLL